MLPSCLLLSSWRHYTRHTHSSSSRQTFRVLSRTVCVWNADGSGCTTLYRVSVSGATNIRVCREQCNLRSGLWGLPWSQIFLKIALRGDASPIYSWGISVSLLTSNLGQLGFLPSAGREMSTSQEAVYSELGGIVMLVISVVYYYLPHSYSI